MSVLKDILSVVLTIAVVMSIFAGFIYFVDLSGDGMTVYQDLKHGTDPLEYDTSGNGLSDYEEVYVYETPFPTKYDSNNSGFSDYEEVQAGADPGLIDTNGDGVYDRIALEEGLDPVAEDTIGNGLSDYEELYEYNTDPTQVDTNGDGITDYEAIHEYEIDPLAVDSSGNGLSDAKAVELGLNPAEFDSSGDKLPDGFTYHEEQLDVDRYNYTVEITTESGVNLSQNSFEDIKNYYDTIPVESKQGEQGINVVFIQTDTNTFQYNDTELVTGEEYRTEAYESNSTLNGYGVHHMSVVHDFESSTVFGAAYRGIDGMTVEKQSQPDTTADIVLHEMGHQAGLWSYQYEGIDSTEISWNNYPSVMNYNRPCGRSISQCPQLNYSSTDYEILQDDFEENQAETHKLVEKLEDEDTTYEDVEKILP